MLPMKKAGLSSCTLLIVLIAFPLFAKGNAEPVQHETGAPSAEEHAASGLYAEYPAPGAPAAEPAPGPLSVESAVRAALNNSAEIEVERLNLRRSVEATREAKAANGPTVRLQTSGSLMSNPAEGFTIEKGAFGSLPSVPPQPPIELPVQDVVLIEDTEPIYFKLTAALSQFLRGESSGARLRRRR